MISFMPSCGQVFVPKFAQTLVWQGAIASNPTVDVSSYIKLPYSNIVVVQLYDAGGAETFYVPPTAKLNGSNMPLANSVYSNAFDDGFATAVSIASVSHGAAATVSWGTSKSDYAYIYVVVGFKNLFSALYNTASATNQNSNNSACPSTVTVNTTSLSKVLYITLGNVTAGVDKSGEMDSFIAENQSAGTWEIGWDYSLTGPTHTYANGNRLALVCSFNLDTI